MKAYLRNQFAYGRKLLSATRASLPPSGWVFEVGCGAGSALQAFLEADFRVAGCDYSAELVAAARRGDIAHAYHGTLDDIARKLDSRVKADLIYLHHVFEHLNDPFHLLMNCRQHLNPQGQVVIVVPDVSQIDSYENPNGDLMVFLHIAHKFNFSFEGLRRLRHRAGYEVASLSPDPRIRTTASDMPELWIEMRPRPSLATAMEGGEQNLGEEMRLYLVRTERRYSRRLRRSRLRARFGRLFPRRLLKSLRPSLNLR